MSDGGELSLYDNITAFQRETYKILKKSSKVNKQLVKSLKRLEKGLYGVQKKGKKAKRNKHNATRDTNKVVQSIESYSSANHAVEYKGASIDEGVPHIIPSIDYGKVNESVDKIGHQSTYEKTQGFNNTPPDTSELICGVDDVFHSSTTKSEPASMNPEEIYARDMINLVEDVVQLYSWFYERKYCAATLNTKYKGVWKLPIRTNYSRRNSLMESFGQHNFPGFSKKEVARAAESYRLDHLNKHNSVRSLYELQKNKTQEFVNGIREKLRE